MTRRSLTPKRKREIAAFNGWRTPQGEQVAIENGELVTLHDGRKIEYDHRYQLALGGADETANMQLITPAAHTEKSGKDAKLRAKDRRLRGKNKRRLKRSWPKGRGFGIPGWRKTLKGPAVRI